MAGVEVRVERLPKSFGRANIWSDVALTLPPGEVSVLLGPSGTGRSVFLADLRVIDVDAAPEAIEERFHAEDQAELAAA